MTKKLDKMILIDRIPGTFQQVPSGNTMQERMEDLSFAYVEILSAENGYTLSYVKRDNDGIDAVISCKGLPALGCKMYSPRFDIQLKASYGRVTTKKNGDISFELESKNYNNLVLGNRMVPAVLVLLHMPKDEKKWVKHTKQCLKITKCAYWVNLKHLKFTHNKQSIVINIPKGNVLSGSELKRIMIKVSNNEEL